MSMLAERKRKQRWSLNPRGKLFLEDKNNFGHKMLQKMGWKHGKGLGANEDGISESLRPNYKNDLQGMGYKETEACSEHDSNFSSLLKTLNANHEKTSEDVKITSLEKKSEKSRARIHYHKFTKGKDLSRYSEKDLANIFGKKTLSQNDIKSEIEEPKEDMKCVDDNLINKGSMTDYFKKKFETFSQNFRSKSLKSEQSDSDQENVGFGFVKQELDSDCGNVTNLNESQNCEEIKKIKKEKKKKDNCIPFVYETNESNGEVAKYNGNPQDRFGFGFIKQEGDSDCLNVTNLKEESQNCGEGKIKKKKKRDNCVPFVYETNESNDGNSQERLGFGFIKQEMESNCVNNINLKEESEEVKIKKKKKRDNCIPFDYERSESHTTKNNEDLQEVIGKSKTKKKKNKTDEDLVDTENTQENPDKNIENSPEKVKKKSKKAKNCEFVEQNEIETWNLEENISDEPRIKQKKVKETRIDIDLEQNIESTPKSKRKKLKKVENNDYVEEIVQTEVNVEEDCKKMKYKKKNQAEIKENIEENDEKLDIPIESKKDEFEDDNVNESKKNKKNKSKIQDFDKIEVVEKKNEMDIENATNGEKESPNKHKKSKKSKKTKEEAEVGISNLAFNDLDSTIDSISSPMEQHEITPKKKKRKYEDISQGIENPTFDATSSSRNESNTNFYEVENPKKRKKSKDNNIGLDNPALNLSDIVLNDDLMLNVATTPILKKEVPKYLNISKIKKVKRKSVRFSDVLQERIIPNDPTERTNEYLLNRNELFDINTSVIEENLKEEMEKQGLEYQNRTEKLEINDNEDISKRIVESSVQEELNRSKGSTANSGFVNNGFDIRSVDKINFYDCKYEIKSSNEQKGIDNKGFNKFKNKIEESIEDISNKIDNYQVEVENDINESKDNKRINNKLSFRKHFMKDHLRNSLNNNDGSNSNNESINGIKKNCNAQINNIENANGNNPGTNQIQDGLVGDVGTQLQYNIKVNDGSKLCFKDMSFNSPVPHYVKNYVSRAKRSYRHLIRGDITVAFKNANLHDIKGYAIQVSSKTTEIIR